ncbi:MAG: NADH-quinone oxidoreductase subunit NuoF [Luteitalea sp.]|nr:NADH-quinone oxidoreductase subunit NuoF [Luteitalea sp.]
MDPVLTKHIGEPNAQTLDFSLQHGAYAGLRKALGMAPDEIIDWVKKSGLRGRGGAGFPTGMKWGFVPKDSPKAKYLCVNADESEPGTFKDHVLMERNPHLFFEGCVIACRAIRAKVCYIYIRGEFYHLQRVLETELARAYEAGFVGANILGSGEHVDIYIHRGAGAYEAGEETALIESLEGKRAQPRLKPPFPAVVGLYGCPTVVNNVETLCNVPLIFDRGWEWYAGIGPDKNTGPKLYCVSGHVNRPGVYEADMSVTLRQLIYDYAGGIPGGRQLKAVIPGGSSTNVLPADKIDVAASFDGLVQAGSMLGSAGIIVMDETTSMVWVAKNLLHFYEHESCGKCTPCREGTDWLYKILSKVERGEGELRDLGLLFSVADNIGGKTLCPFGDAVVPPVASTLQHFREDYETHVRVGRPPLPPWRAQEELIGAH